MSTGSLVRWRIMRMTDDGQIRNVSSWPTSFHLVEQSCGVRVAIAIALCLLAPRLRTCGSQQRRAMAILGYVLRRRDPVPLEAPSHDTRCIDGDRCRCQAAVAARFRRQG